MHPDHFPHPVLDSPTYTAPIVPRQPFFIFAQNLLGKMIYEKA